MIVSYNNIIHNIPHDILHNILQNILTSFEIQPAINNIAHIPCPIRQAQKSVELTISQTFVEGA